MLIPASPSILNVTFSAIALISSTDKELAIALDTPFIGVLTGKHAADELKHNSTVKTVILNSVNEIDNELIFSLF